ncbi:MAG: gliding motility-associated C-terminal domain-containing protein [Bacteroidota bacterium]
MQKLFLLTAIILALGKVSPLGSALTGSLATTPFLTQSTVPKSTPTMMDDSPQLLNLYFATSPEGCQPGVNGTNGCWTNSLNWDQSSDLDEWFGIETGNDGRVTCIDLDDPENIFQSMPDVCMPSTDRGNQLSGELPSRLRFPALECLYLSFNKLTGAIPDLSACPRLSKLYMTNNQLSGTIPSSLSEPVNLSRIELQYNDLNGSIPAELASNPMDLFRLWAHDNRLSGPVPNFFLMDNFRQLNVGRNQFTFSDILPVYLAFQQRVIPPVDPTYSLIINGQAKVFVETTFKVGRGLPFTIDLGIDEGLASNRYRWQNTTTGQTYQIVGDNQLHFDSITDSDGGTYLCTITNDNIPAVDEPSQPFLTLESEPITLEVCEPGVLEIKERQLCPDYQVHIVDPPSGLDTIFDRSNPRGRLILDDRSFTECDSVIIVDLDFPPFVEAFIRDTLCAGDCFYLQLGDRDTCIQASGIHDLVFEGANHFGCDSIIHLDLRIADIPTLGTVAWPENEVLCQSSTQWSVELPASAEIAWVLTEGSALIENPLAPRTRILDLGPGENWFRGLLYYRDCPWPYDSTELLLYYEPELELHNDTFRLFQDEVLLEQLYPSEQLELVYDDDWSISLVEAPQKGTLDEFYSDGQFTYRPTPFAYGWDVLQYELVTNTCQQVQQATVFIDIRRRENDIEQPNLITPNGDGFNDTFVLPQLDSQEENVLMVYNQWGDLVARLPQYDNQWDGNGLPSAVYFYQLWSAGQYRPLSGYLLILR